jgi:hypothetical protein
VLRAAEASLRPGFSSIDLDIGAALALARAEGVPGEIASVLLSAAAEGVRKGEAERRQAEKEGVDG